MDIPFVKIEVNKNAYAIIQNEIIHPNLNLNHLAYKMANKSTGISCDGVLIIDDHYKPIPTLTIFNSDGSEAMFSVHGLAATGYYLLNTKFKKNNVIKVKTNTGVYEITQHDDDTISVSIHVINYYHQEVTKINRSSINGYLIDIGNLNYYMINKRNMNHKQFKSQLGKHLSNKYHANVGLIDILNPNFIHVMTYEKGVGITNCSGSNICGAVYILNKEHLIDDFIEIETMGGMVTCEVNNNQIIYKTNVSLVSKGVFYL